ncbi:phage virion morphogenesis protein [Pseudomonas sp. Marseille-Q5115]|uniref:phage virion morphogenesis protein n=1 Tax=Pseudomonas sp. Marseille-Q5115 TaxID=2866593 RepID=UPI001CE3C410|nr:phage virion morphogenesis protein [Pseudomonas sp. Marseille-Q5115]
MSELVAVEEWVSGLLARLQPTEQRKVLNLVARDLRRSHQKRVQAQRNPDGTPFAPRKPKKDFRGKQGRIKGKMFTKLRLARYMRASASSEGLAVGFSGRVARIARVHQYGLKDRPEAGQEPIKYSVRELLGLTTEDLDLVRDALLNHLAQ